MKDRQCNGQKTNNDLQTIHRKVIIIEQHKATKNLGEGGGVVKSCFPEGCPVSAPRNGHQLICK